MDEIEQMTAREAADAASLLSGTVHAPVWVRVRDLVKFAVAVLGFVAVLKLHLSVLTSILVGSVLLILAFLFARMTVDNFLRSVTFDGFTGQFVCHRPFRREWVFYASQIDAIARPSEQYGKNTVEWVRTGKTSTPVVNIAHFEDSIVLQVGGDACYAVRSRTAMGRASCRSYEGGDAGIEAFDRYLRLYERSMRPDPEPDEDGLAYQRAHFRMDGRNTADMPGV